MSSPELFASLYKQVHNISGATLVPNLLLDVYHKLDISTEELLVLMHLLRAQMSTEGSSLACSDYLMEKMNRSRSEVGYLLKRLQSKGLLSLPRDAGTIQPQDVSLELLYGYLLAWAKLPEQQKQVISAQDEAVLVRAFENYFVSMTAHEYDKIRMWLEVDGWKPEIVLEALHITALLRIRNFRYIDTILVNWKMKGLQTLEEVRMDQEEYDRQKFVSSEASVEETRKTSKTRSVSRGKRTSRPNLMEQGEESREERKKRYDRLIE